MGGDSTPKRQLEDGDALEPDSKYPKLIDNLNEQEDDEHPQAYTRLPPEILLNIFDYLKPDDDCMKKLSEVCKKFYNLCTPRLRILTLDFDKIIKTNRYPVIRRDYTEIRISGNEIPNDREEIGKVLQSSGESARRLVIKPTMDWCKIKVRTLMFILRSLPNLEDIDIDMVQGLLHQISSKAIKPHEEQDLTNLRKLTITYLYSAGIQFAFAKAENIEELKLHLVLVSKQEREALTAFVAKQKNLKLFDLNVYIPPRSIRSMPLLDATVGGNNIESLLKNFPKLEHLKLSPDSRFKITQALLTAGPPVASLKTIDLSYIKGPFNIDQVRKKFPSLESFKCFGHAWTADQIAKMK